jgi:hypothetical protein
LNIRPTFLDIVVEVNYIRFASRKRRLDEQHESLLA